MAGGHLLVIGVLAQDGLSDAEASRRVFLTAGGLLLLGLGLLIGTVWWWRGTRPEHPVLGPLEVMGDRRWAKASPHERQRMIESVRAVRSQPAGAATADASPSTPTSTSRASTAAVVPASRRAYAADVSAGNGPEPVDLSLLVGAGSTVPEDLAEIDVLLGLVPGHGSDPSVRGDGRDRAVVPIGDEAADTDLDDEQDRSAIDPLLQRTSAKD